MMFQFGSHQTRARVAQQDLQDEGEEKSPKTPKTPGSGAACVGEIPCMRPTRSRKTRILCLQYIVRDAGHRSMTSKSSRSSFSNLSRPEMFLAHKRSQVFLRSPHPRSQSARRAAATVAALAELHVDVEDPDGHSEGRSGGGGVRLAGVRWFPRSPLYKSCCRQCARPSSQRSVTNASRGLLLAATSTS